MSELQSCKFGGVGLSLIKTLSEKGTLLTILNYFSALLRVLVRTRPGQKRDEKRGLRDVIEFIEYLLFGKMKRNDEEVCKCRGKRGCHIKKRVTHNLRFAVGGLWIL